MTSGVSPTETSSFVALKAVLGSLRKSSPLQIFDCSLLLPCKRWHQLQSHSTNCFITVMMWRPKLGLRSVSFFASKVFIKLPRSHRILYLIRVS